MRSFSKVQILVDNVNSWIVPYLPNLADQIKQLSYDVSIVHSEFDVVEGEILFLLSCEKKFKKLFLNKCNLVVHGSALPRGRGWSPLSWLILAGEKKIPLTLFEATDEIDAGMVYKQIYFETSGLELIDELRLLQFQKTMDLILTFLKDYPNVEPLKQVGEATFFKRRTKSDSMLDIHKSIDEQFNQLRVVDNERYPAYFIKDGQKFVLKIFKSDD